MNYTFLQYVELLWSEYIKEKTPIDEKERLKIYQREYHKEYYKNNRDKIIERNREYMKRYYKKYYLKNK